MRRRIINKNESGEDTRIYAQGRLWTPEQLSNYRKYQNEFIKNTYRSFLVRFHKIDELPMIKYLEGMENTTGYIKDLIRKDMESKGLETGPSDNGRNKGKV